MSKPYHIGQGPTSADYANLAGRYIDKTTADAAHIRRLPEFDAREALGRLNAPVDQEYAGLGIPYLHQGDSIREWRIRRDTPDYTTRKDGSIKPEGKYMTPPGRRSMIYLPPEIYPDSSVLQNSRVPIIITEGEFKCLALHRLTLGTALKGPMLPIAISGVWNFRGKVGKVTTSSGKSKPVKGVLDDFDWFAWKGRPVVICFDPDSKTKPLVRAAFQALRRVLEERGAVVWSIIWPDELNDSINGIDDYLAAFGPDAGADLLRKAKQLTDVKTDSDRILYIDGAADDLWSQMTLHRYIGIPKVKPIVDRLIYQASLAMICGGSATGKSTLAAQIGLGVARGEEVLGFQAVPTPVLVLDRENHGSLVYRDYFDKLGITAENIPPNYYHWGVAHRPGPSVKPAIEGDYLQQFCKEKGGLVIIDAMVCFQDGDENSSVDNRKFMDTFRDLAQETGCSFLIVHHTGKDERRMARGSSDQQAALDLYLMVYRKDKREKLGDVEIHCVKDRYGFNENKIFAASFTAGEGFRISDIRRAEKPNPSKSGDTQESYEAKAKRCLEWIRKSLMNRGVVDQQDLIAEAGILDEKFGVKLVRNAIRFGVSQGHLEDMTEMQDGKRKPGVPVRVRLDPNPVLEDDDSGDEN